MIDFSLSNNNFQLHLESSYSLKLQSTKITNLKNDLHNLFQGIVNGIKLQPNCFTILSHFTFKASSNLDTSQIKSVNDYMCIQYSVQIQNILNNYSTEYDFFEANKLSIMESYFYNLLDTDLLYSISNSDLLLTIKDDFLNQINRSSSYSKHKLFFNRLSIDDFNDFDFSVFHNFIVEYIENNIHRLVQKVVDRRDSDYNNKFYTRPLFKYLYFNETFFGETLEGDKFSGLTELELREKALPADENDFFVSASFTRDMNTAKIAFEVVLESDFLLNQILPDYNHMIYQALSYRIESIPYMSYARPNIVSSNEEFVRIFEVLNNDERRTPSTWNEV